MVRRVVAQRQQAAVDRRVQRLDPAVQHLGKAGQRGDVAHRQAGLAQRRARAAGRDQLDAAGGQPRGERDQAGLVGDGQQGAGNLDRKALGGPASSVGIDEIP